MTNHNIFSPHQKQKCTSKIYICILNNGKTVKIISEKYFHISINKIVNQDSALDIQLKTNKEYEIAQRVC